MTFWEAWLNPHENKLSSVVVTAVRDIMCHDPPPRASLDEKSCEHVHHMPANSEGVSPVKKHPAVVPPIFQHWRRIASKQGLWYTRLSAVINQGLRPTVFAKKGFNIDKKTQKNEKNNMHSATHITFLSGVLWLRKEQKRCRSIGTNPVASLAASTFLPYPVTMKVFWSIRCVFLDRLYTPSMIDFPKNNMITATTRIIIVLTGALRP